MPVEFALGRFLCGLSFSRPARPHLPARHDTFFVRGHLITGLQLGLSDAIKLLFALFRRDFLPCCKQRISTAQRRWISGTLSTSLLSFTQVVHRRPIPAPIPEPILAMAACAAKVTPISQSVQDTRPGFSGLCLKAGGRLGHLPGHIV